MAATAALSHHGWVIASVGQLVAVGLADAEIAAVVGTGDWYLVGSRALGLDDALSDWDTLVVRDEPVDGGQLAGTRLDQVFGTVRPAMSWPPDLAGHLRWRAAAGVELAVLDQSACARRERADLACWAHELAHAAPLHLATGAGERYRATIARRFAEQAGQLAEQAYLAFRLARNQAVAGLARADPAARALTGAQCVTQAARFWPLALGQPHPADKWLLAVLDRMPGNEPLLDAMRTALDPGHDATTRFDALWRLWHLVDDHAVAAGIDASLLAGSPFVAP